MDNDKRHDGLNADIMIIDDFFNSLKEPINEAKSTMKKVFEIVKGSTAKDVSRRKFETVACKGRNRTKRRKY